MLSAEARRARWEIAVTAKRMLTGEISFLLGAQRIARLLRDSDVDCLNDDFVVFTGVDSETEKLPLDPNVRKLWNADALRELEPEIKAAEKWARKMLEQKCSTLIREFSVDREIHQTAQAILASEMDAFAGARDLLMMGEFADIPERDPDIILLAEIVSTHSYLPLSDGRENWPIEIMEKKFPEIVRAQEWGRATIAPACRNLIERFRG